MVEGFHLSLLDVKVDERGCKACHDDDVDPFASGRLAGP
jgi:hypothetical protein